MNTISEEQVLHNELSFEINQELIHLMKRIIEIQKQNTELKGLVGGLREERDYLFNKLSFENQQLKDRINKAIEYMKEHESEPIDYYGTLFYELGQCEKILDLLKGDKE